MKPAKRVTTILLAAAALAMPGLMSAQASPPPFNQPNQSSSTKMPCTYCHSLHGGNVIAIGTAAGEALCMSCHNGSFTDPVTGKTAVMVVAHNTTGSDYGTWKISCLGCHSPHRDAKADGSETVDPTNFPNGIGNWMLFGDWVREANSTDGLARIRRPVILDTLGNNGGGGRNPYTDDVMDGYYCKNTADIDSAANSGAVRSGGVTTIKTITSHRFAVGNSVRIGGVANTSFNGGPFTIASVPTAKTFTFAQAGVNATSGGGTTGSGAVNLTGCNVNPPSPTDYNRKVVFYDNRYPGSAALNQWSQSQMTQPTTPGAKWYNGACNVCHTRTTHNRRDNSGGDRHNTTRACHDCHLHNKGWIR